MPLTYDQFIKIDDAQAEATAAEERATEIQDRYESATYVLSDLLKRLGYAPAQSVTEQTCTEFFESLMEKHGGEDDVVEEIVEGLKPVDSEVPFDPDTNVYKQIFEEFGVI